MPPEDLANRIEELTGAVADLTAKIPDLVLREEVERKERAIAASLRRVRRLTAAVLVLSLAFFALGAGIIANRRWSDQQTVRVVQGATKDLCDLIARFSEGAKLDRQALIVFATRPGVVITNEQKAVIDAYLSFGLAAYPRVDCDDVIAGRAPPALPPLPERPTVPVN